MKLKEVIHSRKLVLRIVFIFAIFCISMLLLQKILIINTTASQPYGFYLKTGKDAAKGDLVSVCVSHPYAKEAFERGYISTGLCPGGFSPILKEVVAMAGDTIEIKEAGVFVNGQLVPNSAPLKMDGRNRPLPNLVGMVYMLNKNEYFCLSSYSPKSFDGRYLGVMQKSDIQTVIKPLVTW